MFEIDQCEVCDNKLLEDVFSIGPMPLNECLVPIGTGSVHDCEKYPIEIAYCNECYTAHQKFQVPKTNLFQPGYKYRARMTGSVLRGMSDLADSCEKRYGNLSGKLVLDIGCNDGSLLNFFKEKGCKTIGVEPTDAAKDSIHPTINSYFDDKAADQIIAEYGQPDLITFTNVFAHIEDLKGLLAALKKLMGKNTNLVIENHYLGAVLKTGQFDTFYHEHPRTYSKKSFEFIARSLDRNLTGVEFVSRYGGNIRVFIGSGDVTDVAEVDESDFLEKFKIMSDDMALWKKQMKEFLVDHVKKHGKIRAKAFPGRATILVNLLGLDESLISAVYEIKGSIKVGHYVPGTRIPILPEAELYKLDKDQPILNLAWHLPAEVRANLAKNGYTGKVYDIKVAEIPEDL